jgi:hypothetical protein
VGKIIVHFNGKNEEAVIALPEGRYTIVAKGTEIDETQIGEPIANEAKVEGISMMILVKI